MQQPPKFMPDKELSKVGGSLWLYIIMQLTLSFLFSFVAMPLIMYSLYYDYSAINACIEMLISFISGIIILWFMYIVITVQEVLSNGCNGRLFTIF